MRNFSVGAVAALFLLSAVVVVPWAPEMRDGGAAYWLEADLAPSPSNAILYFDDGQGIIADDSVTAEQSREAGSSRLRFSLKSGRYSAFVVHLPGNDSAEIVVRDLRLLDRHFAPIRIFNSSEYRVLAASPAQNVGETVSGHPVPNFDGGGLIAIDPAGVVILQVSLARIAGQVAVRIPWVFFPGLLVFAVLSARPTWRDAAVRPWFLRRPMIAIMMVAGGATIISSYPVVFLGKSLTSPNFLSGGLRLYDQHPTLPGMAAAELDDVKAADVTAFGLQHGPYAAVQHQALFVDGELPLWNRYNSGGTVLLAQGQSMFGDPLHLLVVAADGAAWSWDVKFVVARWWFALGLALLVWLGTRHLPSALLTAISAPFIGFFVVRVNHPAVFSMCYAPWILVACYGVCNATNRRQLLIWMGALVGANWMEAASGTAKEAWVLVTVFNLTGMIMLAFWSGTWRWKLGRFAAVSAALMVFVFLAAPLWWTFLDVLPRSHTMYDGRTAYQISPSLLLGLFDEIFYRPVVAQQRIWNPSANFLTLGGVLLAVVTWRQMPRDAFKTAVAVAAGLALSLAFGVVPPTWIARVPLLGNIGHIDNAFSCPLIILLIVLAGYGFRAGALRLGSPEGRGDLATAGLLLFALFVFPWLGFAQVVHRQAFGDGSVVSLWPRGGSLAVHEYVWASLLVLPAALFGLALVWRRRMQTGRWSPATVLLLITGLVVLLWRHGQQAPGILDMYVVNPPQRVDLSMPSPGLESVRASHATPARVAGIGHNLEPGWSAMYGLESLTGCDALMNREIRELAMGLGFRYEIDWRLAVPTADLARLRSGGDMFNVADYVARRGAFVIPAATLRRIPTSDLDVFHSDTVWPRAFFVDRVGAYDVVDELAAEVKSAQGRPLAMMHQGELPAGVMPASDLGGRVVVPAHDFRLTANETRFQIEAPGPGMVVLHEAWLRGDFVARINGRSVDYSRVNHAFKGCWLEAAGSYEISFRYRPAVWTPALLLAGIGFAIVLGAAVALAQSIRAGARRSD